MNKQRINEIWGVFFLLLGFFSLASILFFHPGDIAFYTSTPAVPAHNVTGTFGAYLAFGLLGIFGWSALLVPAILLLWAACLFIQNVPERKFFKLIGLLIALFSTAALISISIAPELRLERGGAVGYILSTYLLKYIGAVGSFILSVSCLMLSVLLATDFLLYPLFRFIGHKCVLLFHVIAVIGEGLFQAITSIFQPAKARAAREKSREEKVLADADKAEKSEKLEKKLKSEPQESSFAGMNIPLKVKKYQPETEEKEEKLEKAIKQEKSEDSPKLKSVFREAAEKPVAKVKENDEGKLDSVIGTTQLAGTDYQFPALDYLRKPSKDAVKTDNLEENSKIVEQTLAEFGIEVKVTEIEQGPVITRYELLPAPGVKVNSIAALSDDLALALKATSIRLIVPIPGKSAVGVEVPNSVSSVVTLREMVESSNFKSKKAILPLCLGKDTSGRPLIADLASMPHILIAGTTGSGKTVCVNSIVTGLLYYSSPDELKFVMVDPKMVELAVYNKIPHMLAPVVTDPKKAAHTLNWVVTEMENRYKLLAKVGVRNIQSFNNRPMSPEATQEVNAAGPSENVIPAKLPYIVVIIDELADLMMVAQDKVETAIARLAQLSRAVGIHLILATQRPSVDVITGVIKANFPARIAFKVASKVDSRTVIDGSGADKLLGRGDMLFIQPGDAKPARGQACLIMDEEINSVVKFVSEQAKPEYHPEIAAVQTGKTNNNPMEKDEFFDEAVAIVLETGQASTSNLQRRLRLGYTRAARIIDQMEAAGIIGPQQGAKPRDILIDRRESEPVPVE